MKVSFLVATLLVTLVAAEPKHNHKEVASFHHNQGNTKWLVDKIKLNNLLKHAEKLNGFAKKHQNTRAFSTEGHKLTIKYIQEITKKAGYKVKLQPFTARFSHTVSQKLTVLGDKKKNIDIPIFAMTNSASTPKKGVTAEFAVVPDVAGEKGTTGCEDGDYKDVNVKGKIALIERGGCSFNNKSLIAGKHGAIGVVVFNNVPNEPVRGTLGNENISKIPTGGITQESGKQLIELSKSKKVKLNLNLVQINEDRKTYNVIAETKHGDPNNVVVVGAHSDSVVDGPGLNDNGSGSIALLEVAYQMRNAKPKNKVRFIWFSAEEFGLLGSEHYVKQLSKEEIKKIAVMLNFDMIASPNYRINVYNGDSDNTPLPPGSEKVTQLFVDYFKKNKIAYVADKFPYSRSDVGPFAAAGIPSGGVDTGAEGKKSKEEEKLFGGKAGEAYDKCYHAACDNIKNLNKKAFITNAKAIAHGIAYYQKDVSSVRNPKVKRDFVARAADKEHTHSGDGCAPARE
ncbi:uncharacterized protein VTP21DRAFT_6003 [Calcarisporiella thermophila]|uniref:uncharacterized protein n=1 Tax=Calcarisporiella thermophila TaxID=911321 RepID=UPI00374369AC